MNNPGEVVSKSLQSAENILRLLAENPQLIKLINIFYVLIILIFGYALTKLIFDRRHTIVVRENTRVLGKVEGLVDVFLKLLNNH